MDLLWKKNANGSYIDIFANVDENLGLLMLRQLRFHENQKKNETSTQL